MVFRLLYTDWAGCARKRKTAKVGEGRILGAAIAHRLWINIA
jgi:hypothetical protein